MRALELRSAMVSHWKLTMTNWEQSSKLTLLTQEVGEELNINHFMVIQDLKQIGKVNKLDKWIPHELTANQKLSFWSVLFYVTTAKLFLIGLWCVMKVDFIWQLATTSSMAEPEEATKHFSQANLHEKKVMITVWRSAADLIHYSFLNPGETITSEKYAQQTEDLHRKLQCLQPALAYRKGPILHDNAQPHVAQPRLQKLNKLGYEVLRIHYVHLTSQSKLLLFQATQQLFARKTLLQSAGGRKCFPRVCQIPKHGFLCYRNKQTFLIGKNVLIVMVPILINEAVFEPSYNDLKFTVQNHN